MALEHVCLPGAERSAARSAGLAATLRWLAHLGDGRLHRLTTASSNERLLPADMAQARSSEVDEFEIFVHRFERQMLNYLWRMTGEEQSAYDLAQEVFVRAWQHFNAINRYEQPHAWLYRVATNLALTHKSSRKRQATRMSDINLLPDDTPGASDPARRFAESELVRQTLLQLSLRRRAALVLREVYGLSTTEVGAALGMSETAVRMAISRAREQFRALYLEGEGLV